VRDIRNEIEERLRLAEPEVEVLLVEQVAIALPDSVVGTWRCASA